VLIRALELSRQAEEDDCLVAPSEELAAAAESSLRAEWLMSEGSSPNLERTGKVLRVLEKDGEIRSWMLIFGGHLMIHDEEFCRYWGLQDRLEELREQEQQPNPLAALGQQLAQSINRNLGLPWGNQIYAGKRGSYHLSDMSQMNGVGPDEVELTDQLLAPLGFAPIGDLVSEAVAGAVMRVYSCPEADCWAVVNAGLNQLFIREFFSACEDEIRLTTTSLPFAESKPEKKLFKLSQPEEDWDGLLKAHRAEIRRRGWHPQPRPKDLAAVAASLDEYLVRFS